jgi:hypothetical protein
MQTKSRQRTEAQEWYFRLINDPEYFERWRYIYTINDYSSLIEEFQKLYDQTYITDRSARTRTLSGLANQSFAYAYTILLTMRPHNRLSP